MKLTVNIGASESERWRTTEEVQTRPWAAQKRFIIASWWEPAGRGLTHRQITISNDEASVLIAELIEVTPRNEIPKLIGLMVQTLAKENKN